MYLWSGARSTRPAAPNDHHADDASGTASLAPTAVARPPSAATAPATMKGKEPETFETPHDRVLRGLTAPSSSEDVASASLASPLFPSGPEDVYDPATGALAGTLRSSGPNIAVNRDLTDVEPGRPFVSPPPSFSPTTARPTAAEDMWAQLSKIRVLQSEIAKMHMALDKPGIVDSTVVGGGAGIMSPTKSVGSGMTGIGGQTEGVGRSRSGTNPEAPPVDEFAKRKESIGAIMSKLDALSVAVTEFHTLPTPPLDFPSPSDATSSRANSLQPLVTPQPSHRMSFMGRSTAPAPPHDPHAFVQPSMMMSTFSSLSNAEGIANPLSVGGGGGTSISKTRVQSQSARTHTESIGTSGWTKPIVTGTVPAGAVSTSTSASAQPQSNPRPGANPNENASYITDRPSASPQTTAHSFVSHHIKSQSQSSHPPPLDRNETHAQTRPSPLVQSTVPTPPLSTTPTPTSNTTTPTASGSGSGSGSGGTTRPRATRSHPLPNTNTTSSRNARERGKSISTGPTLHEADEADAEGDHPDVDGEHREGIPLITLDPIVTGTAADQGSSGARRVHESPEGTPTSLRKGSGLPVFSG